MNIKSVIRIKFETIDCYDIGATFKEQVVDKKLFDIDTCSSATLLDGIRYSDLDSGYVTKKGHTFPTKGYCSVINKATGEKISFENFTAFTNWKESVSITELLNFIIEVKSANIDGKVTQQYTFEYSDMELSSNKRLKLYNFEVLERDTGITIPEISFEETNCLRGIKKIEDAIKQKKVIVAKNTHIIRLNGIDITEHFTDSGVVSIRYLKKEERGSSHFRYVHRGLNERIENLQKTGAILGVILKDDPVEQEKALAPIRKELQELQDLLKAKGI